MGKSKEERAAEIAQIYALFERYIAEGLSEEAAQKEAYRVVKDSTKNFARDMREWKKRSDWPPSGIVVNDTRPTQRPREEQPLLSDDPVFQQEVHVKKQTDQRAGKASAGRKVTPEERDELDRLISMVDDLEDMVDVYKAGGPVASSVDVPQFKPDDFVISGMRMRKGIKERAQEVARKRGLSLSNFVEIALWRALGEPAEFLKEGE